MGSDSPPGAKPTAIPSHMLSGSSPLQRSTGSRDARERESLNSSIRTSFEPRIPLSFSDETETPDAEAESTQSTSATASVPIRSVVPVRYEHDNVAILSVMVP